MTGAELADRLDAWIAKNPHISRWRVGVHMRSGRTGINQIRKTGQPKQATIDRALALIANPPPEVHCQPYGPKRPQTGDNWRKSHGCENPYLEHDDRYARPRGPSHGPSHAAKVVAGIMRSNRRKAAARIASGLGVGGPGSSAAITCAQRALEGMLQQQARQNDPLEQAKTVLRKQGLVVYSMSVVGGPADHFVVGSRKNVPASEVMALAEQRRAA